MCELLIESSCIFGRRHDTSASGVVFLQRSQWGAIVTQVQQQDQVVEV